MPDIDEGLEPYLNKDHVENLVGEAKRKK